MKDIKKSVHEEGELKTEEQTSIDMINSGSQVVDLDKLTQNSNFTPPVKNTLKGLLGVWQRGTEEEKKRLNEYGYSAPKRATLQQRGPIRSEDLQEKVDMQKEMDTQKKTYEEQIDAKEKHSAFHEGNSKSLFQKINDCQNNLAAARETHVQSLTDHLQSLTEILAALKERAGA